MSRHPYAPYADRVLSSFHAVAAVKRSFTYEDAYRACPNGGAASGALFYLVELGRLTRSKLGGSWVYALTNTGPVVGRDWERLSADCREVLNGVVVSRRSVRREARESARPRVAKADVVVTSRVNEHGRSQSCVEAECPEGGGEGFAWGTSAKSVARALIVVTGDCSCGAKRHEGS